MGQARKKHNYNTLIAFLLLVSIKMLLKCRNRVRQRIFFPSLEYALHNCLERIVVSFPYQNVRYGGK